MFKVKQQKLALRVALYVLHENNFTMPKKSHVLSFIRMKNLLRFPEHELGRRNPNDIDEIWANDICWKRKDLFDGGEVGSPEKGKWRINESGINWIKSKAEVWIRLSDPKTRAEVIEALDYCTEELLDWMLKIARGDDLSLIKKK